ncbi:MAG: glycosyltransferase family 39 protein [Ignavibacteria bacterium]|nr:glycosyltransferase family 39 protein [Ignavibacteria bacterium]
MNTYSINKNFWITAFCFIIIGFIIYSPGIDAPRYGDDYTIVPENSNAVFEKIWTSTYQRLMFYRPIEDTITTLFIFNFGWNTLPTHILFILLHSSFSVFLFYVMLKLKFSKLSALIAALYMLLSQVSVTAVGGNDTLGQLITSFLTFLNLWIIYRSIETAGDAKFINYKYYAFSVFIFAVCLLTKETSATFIPLLFMLLLVKIPIFKNRTFNDVKKIILMLIPYLIIFAIFFLIRSKIVTYKPGIGTGVYDFNIGINIPKNIGMLIFSLLLPFSSVRVFEAVHFRDLKILLPVLAVTAVFALVLLWGIWRGRKIKEVLVLGCFMIAGFFPPAILNHVNEQYTYYSLPFFILIIALASEYYINNNRRSIKTVFFVFAAILLVMNAFSVMDKTRMIGELGWRAKGMTDQIEKFLPQVSHNGSLVLVNPKTDELRYSAFKQPGFEPMRYTEFMLYHLAERNDFKLQVIEENEIQKFIKPGVLILKYEGEKVVKY